MHTTILDISDDKLSQFADEFGKQLAKPSKTIDESFIIYFIGMIGSGKSTTARFLSQYYGLVRVSTDDIRDFLEENGFSRERSFDIAEIVAERLLQQGYGVCFDADLVDQYFRDHVIALSEAAGVQALLVQIKTPEKIILERLRADNPDRRYKGEGAIQDYMRRKSKFERITAKPVVVIDGSANFDEQMKYALKAIDKELEKRH